MDAYQQLMAKYQALYERQMGMLSQRSTQGAADINTQYDKLGAGLQSQLVQRGLGNSSLMATTATGVARDRGAALTRFGDEQLQQRMTADRGLSENMLELENRKRVEDMQKRSQQQQLADRRPYWTDSSGMKRYGYYGAR